VLTKRKKQIVINKTKLHDSDTGSPEVQISLLTKKIDELSSHLKKHKKDNSSRRGLLQMVEDRRKLIKYLQKKSGRRYNLLANKIGIKKTK